MKHSSKQITELNSIDKQSVEAFNKQIKHLQQQYPRQFSLCLNLSCGINNSIQKPLQIPPEMLSQSLDMHGRNSQFNNHSQQLAGENKSRQQKEFNKESEERVSLQKIFVKQEESNQVLIEEESYQKQGQRINLNLQELVKGSKMNTKNVLRNFGNAQNQYILYHQNGIKLASQLCEEGHLKEFQEWIRNLKLLNFRDYRNVWAGNSKDNKKSRVFKKIYRKICWDFYENTCIPYIYSGRLNSINRLTHLKQIVAMLKGIQSPQDFNSFRD